MQYKKINLRPPVQPDDLYSCAPCSIFSGSKPAHNVEERVSKYGWTITLYQTVFSRNNRNNVCPFKAILNGFRYIIYFEHVLFNKRLHSPKQARLITILMIQLIIDVTRDLSITPLYNLFSDVDERVQGIIRGLELAKAAAFGKVIPEVSFVFLPEFKTPCWKESLKSGRNILYIDI